MVLEQSKLIGLGFVKGTLVHTREGQKPIEDVAPGDWVLTQNPNQYPPSRRALPDEYLYSQVAAKRCVNNQSLVNLTLHGADGSVYSVLCGELQRFWSLNKGAWVSAAALSTQERVALGFYATAQISKVESTTESSDTFYLQTAASGTYYVGQIGVWAHCERVPGQDAPSPTVLDDIDKLFSNTVISPTRIQSLTLEDIKRIKDAAERVRRIFFEQKIIELEYNEAGISWLAGYIERVRCRSEGVGRKNLIDMLGSFVAETCRREFGGQWIAYDKMLGLQLDNGVIMLPRNAVQKQFDFGCEACESISSFFTTNKLLSQTHVAPLTATQQRLAQFFKQSGMRIFFPSKVRFAVMWVEAVGINDHWVVVEKQDSGFTRSTALSQIHNFYVCDASGALVYHDCQDKNLWDTLPADIQGQIRTRFPLARRVRPEQLTAGKHYIEISFATSTKQVDGVHCYATSVRNISNQKIKIIKFAGLTFNGSDWGLASVTDNFYGAEHFKDWYKQSGEWLLPGDDVCYDENWGDPPILWTYFGLTEHGDSFIAGECLQKPITVAQATPSGVSQTVLRDLIWSVRTNLLQAQAEFKPKSLAAILAKTPHWLKHDDGLNEILQYQKRLLIEGAVVWGVVVQANELLFAPGPDDYPALLVYSPDRYFDEHPTELRALGAKISDPNGGAHKDGEMAAINQFVSDETASTLSAPVQRLFSTRDIRTAAFIVFRKHLPDRMLAGSLLPILIHPDTSAVMIVPSAFWPATLISHWQSKSL